MREASSSIWEAVSKGAKRPLAALGAILTFGVPLLLHLKGHPWTPWWLVPPLLFLLVSALFAYHDLRVKYDHLTSDPSELLAEQMRKLDRVRLWLTLLEDPEGEIPLREDRVFVWAKDTYELLLNKFPAEADAFLEKENAELGSPYFATSYGSERSTIGRREYLETRAEIVRGILRLSEAGTPTAPPERS